MFVKPVTNLTNLRLSRLISYNQMFLCLRKFSDDFVSCNENMFSLASKALHFLDEKSALAGHMKCCAIWMVRDCWFEQAKRVCDDVDQKWIHSIPAILLPGIQEWCTEAPPEHISCRLTSNIQMIILSLLIFLVFGAFVLVIAIILVKHFRRNAHPRNSILHMRGSLNGNKPEAEDNRDSSHSLLTTVSDTNPV